MSTPVQHTIHCPNCNQEYEVDESMLEQKVQCSVCDTTFTVQLESTHTESNIDNLSSLNTKTNDNNTGESKICPNCNYQAENEELFCSKCGTKLEPFPIKKRCESCGSELKPDTEFCSQCGLKQGFIFSEDGSVLLKAPNKITSYVIPYGVKQIGDWAFYGCTSLKSITIPDSVTSIGIAAFGDCSALKNVTVPSSVTNLGEAAFLGAKCEKEIKKNCQHLFNGKKITSKATYPCWLRELSGVIDVYFAFIVQSVVSYILFSLITTIFFSNSNSATSYSTTNSSLRFPQIIGAVILTSLLVLLCDGLIYAIFGTTFSQWAFGFAILNKQRKKISTGEYFTRNALRMNLVSDFLFSRSKKKVTNQIRWRLGAESTYDEELGFTFVRIQPASKKKVIILILLIIIMPIFLFIADAIF